jgi:hypothetical protein
VTIVLHLTQPADLSRTAQVGTTATFSLPGDGRIVVTPGPLPWVEDPTSGPTGDPLTEEAWLALAEGLTPGDEGEVAKRLDLTGRACPECGVERMCRAVADSSRGRHSLVDCDCGWYWLHPRTI